MNDNGATYLRLGVAGDEMVVDACEYARCVGELMLPPDKRATLALKPVADQRQPLYVDMRNVDMLILSTPEDRAKWMQFLAIDIEEARPREPWE